MKHLILISLMLAGLSACGLETATTAATVGAAKQQELEEGQKTMATVEAKIDASLAKSQQRLNDMDAGKKE